MKDIKSFLDIWHKYMYILTPTQKRWGIVVFIVSIFASVAEMLGVSVIVPLVQVIINPEALLQKYSVLSELCERLNINTASRLLPAMIAVVIAVYILKNLFLSFNLWFRTKYSMKIQREISIKMIESYNNRGYDFFRKINYSVYQRGVGASAGAVNSCISFFFKVVAEFLTILCIFIFIAMNDWRMLVTLIVLAMLCMIFIVGIFRKRMQKAGKDSHKFSAINGEWLVQLYFGIKEILVLDRKEYFIKNYEKTNVDVQKAGIKLTIAQEIPAYVIEALCISGIMISVGVRVSMMANPTDYVPQLAAFAVAAFRILPSLGRVSSNFNSLIYQIPFVNEAYTNLKSADEANEKYRKEQEKLVELRKNQASSDAKFEDILSIKGIKFRYPDGQDYVLDGINIDIHKGESIALVGPSGAGKSTLADVILGLLKPQEGKVTVDGMDIMINKDKWSKMIGFVPQSPYLIDDTITKNICFGLYDEEIEESKIWDALKKAQMDEFVKSLPDGLNTMVGERGVRFSGGQAQRLVIARALYNNPDILVLDEATAALDNDTEKAVMDAIESLAGKKTMIIIAHRLTTVKNCSRIYEIKNGSATLKKYDEIV